MRNEDCGKFARLATDGFQAFECLPARNSSVDKNARARAFDNRSIAPAAAREHRDRHAHALQHTFNFCGSGSNSLVKSVPPGTVSRPKVQSHSSQISDKQALTTRVSGCRQPYRLLLTVHLECGGRLQ